MPHAVFRLGAQRIAVEREPVDHVTIDGVFGADASAAMLAEMIALEPHFRPGGVGADAQPHALRSSLICAPDEVYLDPEPAPDFASLIARRGERSALLSGFDSLVLSAELRDLLDGAPWPICKMREINRWETQVAWYGTGHKYDWHLDRIGTDERLISIVYFAFREPRRFTGGELELTDGLASGGEIVARGRTSRIELVHDRAVIFSARATHRVLPIDAPSDFASGRFSVTVFGGLHGAVPAGRAY